MRKRVPRKHSEQRTLYLILLMLLWVVGAKYVLYPLGKHIKAYLNVNREVKTLVKENRELEKEISTEEKKVKNLKAGLGWEEELRRRGWVKEGEIPIKLKGKLPLPPEEKQTTIQKILKWFGNK